MRNNVMMFSSLLLLSIYGLLWFFFTCLLVFLLVYSTFNAFPWKVQLTCMLYAWQRVTAGRVQKVPPENYLEQWKQKMLLTLVGMYSLFLLSIFLIFTTDTDKCEVTHGKCHEKAICNNTHGSYVCTCKPGFIGDGQNCKGTVNSLKSHNSYWLVKWAFVCLFVYRCCLFW